MPTVSVIVPIYKVEKLLDRCVESIINQTYTDFELILVDDGSPDRCGDICDEWANKDDRVKVIHKENGGLSDARNAAINVAKGSYLSFIDSDDYVSPNFLEVMLDAVKRTGSKMSVCNIEAFYDDGKTSNIYCPSTCEKVVFGHDMYDSLYQPSACNKLYERSIFEDIRYPKGKLFEDCFVYHLILEKLDKLVYTGQNLYHYYVRGTSIMHKEYSLKDTDIVEAVYLRAANLDKLGIHDHADEAYLAIYSRLASAYTNLNIKEPEVKERLNELKKLYDSVYKRMITDKHYSIKQKFRIWLLHVSPSLHVKFFPMNTK